MLVRPWGSYQATGCSNYTWWYLQFMATLEHQRETLLTVLVSYYPYNNQESSTPRATKCSTFHSMVVESLRGNTVTLSLKSQTLAN
jgi:hypothetical protein